MRIFHWITHRLIYDFKSMTSTHFWWTSMLKSIRNLKNGYKTFDQHSKPPYRIYLNTHTFSQWLSIPSSASFRSNRGHWNMLLPLLLFGNWDLNQHSFMINSQFTKLKWMRGTTVRFINTSFVRLLCGMHEGFIFFWMQNLKTDALDLIKYNSMNGLDCIRNASNRS